MMRLLTLAVVAALSVVQAAIPGDLITTLPGWNGPTPTKQYSGLINVDPINGRFLHYWFVQSAQNPATDPVVMWMNGGPGCSSLDGYFYEQGPFRFAAQTSAEARAAWNTSADAIPTLIQNPYAWNNIANMLFVEAPAGVGFSYSNNQNDYNTNDTKTAQDNYQFLLKWFAAYPEYTKNQFFISGESYAGIYVPTLADQVRQGNDAGNAFVNLIGIAVGNGCIGNAVGSCSPQGTGINIDFLYGHGLYSTDLYNQIKKTCPDPSNPSIACYALLAEMGIEVSDVNIYNVYAPCVNAGGFGAIPTHHIRHRTDYMQKQYRLGGPDECIDGLLASQYLNNDLVRGAIHVQNMSTGGTWSICGANINYNSNIDSLMPLYPTLISKYRVLIYNGDVDACVAYNGNEQWTSSLGYPVKSGWHSWSTNNQVAGYATVYDAKNSSFQFVTVKGAGHMVPEYMPVQGLEMFRRFITNTPF